MHCDLMFVRYNFNPLSLGFWVRPKTLYMETGLSQERELSSILLNVILNLMTISFPQGIANLNNLLDFQARFAYPEKMFHCQSQLLGEPLLALWVLASYENIKNNSSRIVCIIGNSLQITDMSVCLSLTHTFCSQVKMLSFDNF